MCPFCWCRDMIARSVPILWPGPSFTMCLLVLVRWCDEVICLNTNMLWDLIIRHQIREVKLSSKHQYNATTHAEQWQWRKFWRNYKRSSKIRRILFRTSRNARSPGKSWKFHNTSANERNHQPSGGWVPQPGANTGLPFKALFLYRKALLCWVARRLKIGVTSCDFLFFSWPIYIGESLDYHYPFSCISSQYLANPTPTHLLHAFSL